MWILLANVVGSPHLVTPLLSLSYIPLYVHVRPGYREKSANLQGTLKPNLRFYNRFLRLQTPCNEN